MSIFAAAVPVIGSLLDKLIPDPQARDAAKLEMLKLAASQESEVLNADLQLALGQIEVNKIEASAPDLFRGGWRPAAGWICVAGLGFSFCGYPLVAWLSVINGWPEPPTIQTDDLMLLLLSLLGLGGMRMTERLNGKA